MFIGLLLIAAQPQGRIVEAVVRPLADWVACYTSATERFALQPEPADTVANAVLGACENEEAQLREALFTEAPRPSTAVVNERMTMLRDSARRTILAEIFETRAARSPAN